MNLWVSEEAQTGITHILGYLFQLPLNRVLCRCTGFGRGTCSHRQCGQRCASDAHRAGGGRAQAHIRRGSVYRRTAVACRPDQRAHTGGAWMGFGAKKEVVRIRVSSIVFCVAESVCCSKAYRICPRRVWENKGVRWEFNRIGLIFQIILHQFFCRGFAART